MDEKHTRKDLIKVAKLYYLGNLSQFQIAQTIGVSRPKVSRMLSQARSQNIIEFKIKDFPMMAEEMAEKLKARFDLSKVIIVPSGITPEQSKNNAGKEASEYLNSLLHDGMRIGVSWGTTLQAMIRQFELKKRINDINVVQLAGGVHTTHLDLDSQELVRLLANKLSATYSIMHAPLVVSNSTVRNLLLNEPEIRNHCERFNHLDLALIGVGSMTPEEAIPYKAGYITLEQSHMLVDTGFATDICGNRIFLDGTIRENLLSDRLISISPEQVKKIPTVIAIAVGAEKAIPVIAGAKGRFFQTLIIDEVAALTMLCIEGLS
jgi:deoxyribonucleoside regulator